MPITIQSFSELPREWDEYFLPATAQKVGVTGKTYKRFYTHFCRKYLPEFFQDGEGGEWQEVKTNKTFEEVVEEICQDNVLSDKIGIKDDSLQNHKGRGGRQGYNARFRSFGVPIPEEGKGLSTILLKWLLEEWDKYCQEQKYKRAFLSPRENLARLLLHLNCQHQKRAFGVVQDYCAERQALASAFLLRADSDIYYWLICSLLESIDRLDNATVIPETTGKQLFRDFDQFWQSVAAKIGLPNRSSKADVLDALCQSIQHQNMIMVVNQIDQAKRVLPTFRDEFWLALLDKIETYPETSFVNGSFTLFMIAPSDPKKMNPDHWKTYSFQGNLLDNRPDDFLRCPVVLQNLCEIRNSDVKRWLKRKTVQEFLEQQVGCESVRVCAQLLDKLSDDDPEVVLHDICCELGFQTGLGNIESIWSSSLEAVA